MKPLLERVPVRWDEVRNRHLMLADAILLPLAAVTAFALRLDATGLRTYVAGLVAYALISPLIKIPIFGALGLYSRFWQYASVEELVLLAWAAMLGGLAEGALFLGAKALFPDATFIPGIPRSIPFIDILVTFAFIAGVRFALRVGAQQARVAVKGAGGSAPVQRVLIAGAGSAGAGVLRELRANPQTGLAPVGFVDDDPAKQGVSIQGTRVLGTREDIPDLVHQYGIAQVIIAMPSASGKAIRGIVDICEGADVRVRIIPGIYELLGETIRLHQVRDVQIDDLLRREPVETDKQRVAALLQGRRVLVTGAGGSIGSELCRQIAHFGPAELVLLGHGENAIFDILTEFSANAALPGASDGGPATRTQPVVHSMVADIRSEERLQHLFKTYRPEIVFHAAAHKHVPLMEHNPSEAVTNNVLGTQRLVQAAIAAGVLHFVFISTDKAVNPSSVMGATKRVAELVVQDAATRSGRRFVSVRFGNVLGSRGSVVPLFQKQIAAGGPVTVTHPEMSRYFMTIPEAVQLVLQAGALGQGGEVFVLDMGQPVRILDLARDLIRLSGLEPGRDIQIQFTGIRPGEKLFEETFADSEAHTRTEHEKILVCANGRQGADRSADDSDAQAWAEQRARIASLIAAAERGDDAEVRRLLAQILPEYAPVGDGPEPAAGAGAADTLGAAVMPAAPEN